MRAWEAIFSLGFSQEFSGGISGSGLIINAAFHY